MWFPWQDVAIAYTDSERTKGKADGGPWVELYSHFKSLIGLVFNSQLPGIIADERLSGSLKQYSGLRRVA